MKPRNLSPQRMFADLAERHVPRHRFTGSSAADFAAWQAAAMPEVLATLGRQSPSVDPNPELVVEWLDRGLRCQRCLIDVHPHLSAHVLVYLPADMAPGEKRPAICCWHGHGRHGKEAVMGNRASPALIHEIEICNYEYGYQMARAGYITYAIDWMSIGEHNDSAKPHYLNVGGNRDWCNLYYLHATMLGTSSIALHVGFGKVATDFVCTLPEVDADRLGVMGLSGGGTMTVWSTLCDPRFKASEVICYSDLWAFLGIRDNNYCGMQVAPGLYDLVDLPELQGLIAPRPLLVDIGIHDSCFLIEGALACYRQVERIYAAAGHADRLELDLFPGEHRWAGNKSVAFFQKHLAKP